MKSKKSLLLILCLIPALLLGCEKKETKGFAEADNFYNGMAIVKAGEKYGYIDDTGAIVINPQYDSCMPVVNDLCIVTSYDKSGVVDKNNNVIIPLEYDAVTIFEDQNCFLCQKGTSYFYIDNTGKTLISLDNVGIGDIHKSPKGKTIITIFDSLKMGYINLTSRKTVDPCFDSIGVYEDGDKTLGAFTKGTVNGYIDFDSDTITETTSEENIVFHDNLARVKTDNKYGYINLSGETAIPTIYKTAEDFSYGLASVRIDGKYGCINTNGDLVIPAIYDGTVIFQSPNFSKVALNGNRITINTQGEIINTPPIYQITSTNGDYIIANTISDNYITKCFVMDTDGNTRFTTNYTHIDPYINGMAQVEYYGKKGCINDKGIEVIPTKYDDLFYINNVFIVCDKNKYGIIDKSNKAILDMSYDEIKPLSSTLFSICKDGKYGLYDLSTNKSTPLKYDQIKCPYDQLNESLYSSGFYQPGEYISDNDPIPVKIKNQWIYINKDGERCF